MLYVLLVLHVLCCISLTAKSPCHSVKCGGFKICLIVNGSSICACPSSCPRVRRPVCGADNRTYMNDCFRRLVSCQNTTTVLKAHSGVCDDCARCQKTKKFCEYHSTNGSFYCSRCPVRCSTIWDPKCASDGQTYSNQCFFNSQKCTGATNLMVKYNGTCDAMRKNKIVELAVGISLGVLAICGVIVFTVLWYSFRFRIPKKAKRWERVFRTDA